MQTRVLLAILALSLPIVSEARGRAAGATEADCQLACQDECPYLRPKKCKRLVKKCTRRGTRVCGGMPSTTTTTLPTRSLSGTYGYEMAKISSDPCSTLYADEVGGIISLDVDEDGSITGSIDSAKALTGAVTGATSVSLATEPYADSYGCLTTIVIEAVGMPADATFTLQASQECILDAVCTDTYSGTLQR